MEDNIPSYSEMAKSTPPLSLAETVETTPPLPPPQSVKMADTETQMEREDRESPKRKRKKMTAAVTEAEIFRDSSGDSNNASFEITDDEEEPNIVGREVTKFDCNARTLISTVPGVVSCHVYKSCKTFWFPY